MKREGLAALSAQQRECLRLVAQHMSSKDIAKILGASPHTVDNHIKAAIQRLGVTSRREASRLYAELLNEENRRDLANPSSVVAKQPAIEPAFLLPPEEVRFESEHTASFTHNLSDGGRQAAVGVQGMVRLPIPRLLGDENDLSSPRRVIWIIILTIAALVGLGAALETLELLNRLI